MLNKIKIPINKGWTPDLTKREILDYGGLYEAKNILPVGGSYIPVLDAATYNSNAVSGTPIAGTNMQDSDGTFYNYIGSSTKLYRFDTTNMTDITRAAGGAYTATNWRFEKYGSWIIATDYVDDIQVLKTLSGANFAALGGSPPKAKYCLLNSGHLILAYINDGTAYPKKLQWSARENPETWTASLTTGAGSQNLPDLDGVITGIGAVGDAFVVAAQNSLTVGYYVGGIYTYNFKINAVKNIGCFYPASFISIGSEIFFWGKDSIYRFNGVEQPTDIGKYIRKYFFGSINASYSEKISVAHDKENGLIVWAYPSTASTANNKMLVYNYLEDKFTNFDMDCYCVFIASTGGIFADDIDTEVDDLNYLIDSNYWTANSLQPMIIDTSDSKVKNFSGSALTAELETGEFDEQPTMIRVLKGHLPVEGVSTSGSVVVKHRKAKIDSQTSSSSSSIKSDGTVDLRSTNRFISLNLSIDNFTKIGNTIEAEGIACGGR